ncbi:hypothetical protein FOQG_15877 [Fusarium oxysporum f. sp. raphani 54005]|uniref:Uncharacterized protein n=2 Tax=Fusarium oxysporum f. sp. raphani TaxID=96318 RepID=X0BKU4_FUSOX|nr:hypothetical protein FOQG_15877 [Fusarium oxysporum f. sp. raphani 54005]KAG7413264.1 hypothetical protein Forpi1262_v017028 [Fusarium oxysporum f. sp. raphani]
MDDPRLQPPSDQGHSRLQENEPILDRDETRPPPSYQSQMTPSIEPVELTEWEEPNKKPPSINSFEQIQTWADNAWTIYRTKPWSMYFFFVTGTLFALGHHLFYLNLQGKEADNQSLMLRYGTVIAFCAKASFSTAVVIAFQQRAWMVVRHRMVHLGTIDSIFTANHDFGSLLDWRAIKKAKIATCLALYCWLTPLMVVLTSETLSVVAGAKDEAASCPSARTLNFANEETFNWRFPLIINERNMVSLSIFNTTNIERPLKDEEFTATSFDYWTEYNTRYKLLVDRTVNLRQAAVRENAGQEMCSEGWNCSYVVSFVAPGYKCEEVASGVRSQVRKLGGSASPFNTSIIAPEGNYTYMAVTDQGEYGEQQIRSGDAGSPLQKPPYPSNLGAFRAEPIIWVGYATVDDLSKKQPQRSEKGFDDAYTPVIFGCEHYEVNYTVQFNYTGGTQSYDIKHRDYMRKVVNTTFLPGEKDPDKRLLDRTKATPEQNYVLPSDPRNYRRVAAYHAIGQVFRSYLEGTLKLPFYFGDTNLVSTALITQPNYLPVKRFRQGIQKLYEDIIISFLSEPTFLVVSWASNGEPSGNIRGGASTSYPCVRQRVATFFVYNMSQLLAVYAASLAFALIGVMLGLQAVREEGVVRDLKPSSIIAATRAPSLNELGPGGEQDSRKIRVGYGLVRDQADGGVRGFGLEGNVMQEYTRPRKSLWKAVVGIAMPSGN